MSLKGEMSLVGPRPLLMEYLPLYSAEQSRRHEVQARHHRLGPGQRPQCRHRGNDRFALDVWYVDHLSLMLDLPFALKTIAGIRRRQGIAAEGHATMPRFTGRQGDGGDAVSSSLGAGGHAKVVIATIEACGDTVLHVLDDNAAAWGTSVLGYPIKGPIADHPIPADCWAVVAIGSNRARQAVAGQLRARFGSVTHPSAVVHRSVILGEGTVVFAGAVVQPDTRIGTHCIVNTAASIDHDGQVGAFSHVAPGAHLAGTVTVGEGALIGVGSAVIVGVSVGAWATVGAGSVVIRPVADGATVAGCPARPLSEE